MTRRALISVIASGILAVAGFVSAPLIAQGPSLSESDLTATDGWNLEKHRALARILQRQIGVKDGWQAPRTTWGHPDLTGA